MKNVSPEFKKYADLFYQKNQTYFEQTLLEYQELVKKLNKEFDFERPCELEFGQLISISDQELKQSIIQVGYDFYDLKKAVRKKVVAEYLVHNKGMSVHFLRICEEANNYFEIKDSIVNIDAFLEPIKMFQQDKLDEEGKRMLCATIRRYQEHFNNHHLKKYSTRIFGIPYKTIVAIKDACFKATFGSYATISISKEGTVYTKRDGAQSS